MNQNKFFEKLVKANYLVDPKTLKDVYYSFLRLILEELRDKGIVILVNFGTFRIRTIAARRIYDINAGYVRNVPDCKTISFTPSKRMKVYFN